MITAHEQAVLPVHVAPVAVRQPKPVQQPTAGEHAWPSVEQLVGLWPQVPEVAPPGMLQVSPAQQSPPTVQAAPWGWQVAGAWQVPPLQIPEQHAEAAVQEVPLGRHEPPSALPPSARVPPSEPEPPRTWQAKPSSPAPRHSLPAQHSEPPKVQGVPTGAQVETVQRETPAPSGTQSAPLQH
jgi:hypothetical protein